MFGRALVIIVAVVVSVAPLCAQERTVEELRARAKALERQADSVKKIWGVQWRRSDSLRIESIFLRMRSDSLRKEAKRVITDASKLEQQAADFADVEPQAIQLDAPVTAVPDSMGSVAVDSAVIAALAERHRRVDVKLGQTLSDSATADVMRTDRDTGMASFYAEAFHGKKTSNGEKYNMHDLTCAHRWLPYNTQVRVTNLANGRSVIVRVNDRGPWKHTRLIDVSKGAAKELDMIRSGTARVAIEVVDP